MGKNETGKISLVTLTTAPKGKAQFCYIRRKYYFRFDGVLELMETAKQMITSYAPSHDLIWNNTFSHKQSYVVDIPRSDSVYNLMPLYLKIKCTKYQDAYRLLSSDTSLHIFFEHPIIKTPTVLCHLT